MVKIKFAVGNPVNECALWKWITNPPQQLAIMRIIKRRTSGLPFAGHTLAEDSMSSGTVEPTGKRMASLCEL
jgi:hypothetical protein